MPAVAMKSTKAKSAPLKKKPALKLIELPRRDKGEIYAGGIILLDGSVRHTILLPGEHKGLEFDKAQDWCKKQGGSAPDRVQQLMLFKFLKKEFRPVAYWSCEQSARNGAWAWCQHFVNGSQGYDRKSVKLAVRAVRMIPVI